MSARAYLDYNATQPLRPQARANMLAHLGNPANPSSVHAEGRAARAALEAARTALAHAVGAPREGVVFTSGATEAIGLGVASAVAGAGVVRWVVSGVEHDAVLETVRASGLPLALAPVDARGVLDLVAFEALVAGDPGDPVGPVGAAVMLANNETGVIQPVAAAAQIVRRRAGVLLCDAVQALGRVPINLQDLGAHWLVVSGHKIGGPAGVGALLAGPDGPIARTLHGGGQERGRRGGTENIAAIAGFHAALDAALAELPDLANLAALRDDFEAQARAARPDAALFGADAPRLPNTTSLALPGASAETLVMLLDLDGVAVSAGAACSSGKVKASRVLAATGAGPALVAGAIRISSGWATTPADYDRALDAWSRAAIRLDARRPVPA